MKTKIRATLVAGGLLAIMSAGVHVSLAGAVAIPGDPTASECAVIAQQAAAKGVPFATELANQGGGLCPTPTTTTSTSAVVLGNSVAPTSTGTLPKSGSDVSGIVTMAAAATALGVGLLIINRRRSVIDSPA